MYYNFHLIYVSVNMKESFHILEALLSFPCHHYVVIVLYRAEWMTLIFYSLV